MSSQFEMEINIAWGHCDPAGIIYYPNYFRWFDAAYHAYLASLDLDQRSLKSEIGAFGTGLIDAGAQFKAPVSYGDHLCLSLTIEAWRDKTLRLAYHGTCEGRDIVEGYEVRGLFMRNEETGRIYAAPIAPFRALIEAASPI